MATEYVVDASALAKLFLDEPDSDSFRDWWYQTLQSGAPVRSPSLVRFEIGNLIDRNLGHLEPSQQRRVWRETLAGVQIDDEAVEATFDVPQGTFYDASYISLATKRKAGLVTYDEQMAKTARAQTVDVVRPG